MPIELKPIPPDDLQKLEEKHGDLCVVTAKNKRWQVALRRCPRKEWVRIEALLNNAAQAYRGNEALFRACVVFPPPEAHEAFLDEHPTAPAAVASTATVKDFLGLSVEEDEKT